MIDFDALVLAPAHAIFGESVTYYPGSGPVTTLTGIFNDRYQETKLQDAVEVIDYRTVLNLRAALVDPDPAQGELFRVRGILYVVTNCEPDGIGDLRVTLRAATDREAAKLRPPATP